MRSMLAEVIHLEIVQLSTGKSASRLETQILTRCAFVGTNRENAANFRLARDWDPVRREPGKRTISNLNAIVKD